MIANFLITKVDYKEILLSLGLFKFYKFFIVELKKYMMNFGQTGGAAGSQFGPGYVYVMHYYDSSTSRNYYKIGCSRQPGDRLRQIQRQERKSITLVGYVPSKEMNSAETAAQKAVKEKGMQKDPSRGRATDWFVSRLFTPTEVLSVVTQAVQRHDTERDNSGRN